MYIYIYIYTNVYTNVYHVHTYIYIYNYIYIESYRIVKLYWFSCLSTTDFPDPQDPWPWSMPETESHSEVPLGALVVRKFFTSQTWDKLWDVFHDVLMWFYYILLGKICGMFDGKLGYAILDGQNAWEFRWISMKSDEWMNTQWIMLLVSAVSSCQGFQSEPEGPEGSGLAVAGCGGFHR